jgi:hypothetical protein
MSSCGTKYSSSAILMVATSIEPWRYPCKVHQFKFTDTNKTVPTDLLKLIAFFEQCQVADKAAGILEKIAKDKKQPKEKKTAHLPGMVQANVGHKVTLITLSKGYFCTNFYIRWSRDVTSQSTTTQITNKHHHHGDEAARPSSDVDLMIPHCLRGRRPFACSFQGRS